MELSELIYSWDQTKGAGDLALELVKDFYSCLDGTKEVIDVSARQEFYTKGDLLIKQDGEGGLVELFSEVKGDNWTAKTGNLFLETISVHKYGSDRPGWMITSEADLLDYYSIGDDILYHFEMPPFKKWFDSVRKNFSEIKNSGSGSIYSDEIYYSKGILMPLAYIAKNVKNHQLETGGTKVVLEHTEFHSTTNPRLVEFCCFEGAKKVKDLKEFVKKYKKSI